MWGPEGGAPLGLIEVKVGDSSYTALQRLKDAYIKQEFGYSTVEVRVPWPSYPEAPP